MGNQKGETAPASIKEVRQRKAAKSGNALATLR